ncbi:MAG: exodeoxyribonuclease VII small subunit [Roseburia sp.]|nr:exodeoxyribonuclease VII small subunit [Roseburia sp.]MCM1098315.1 exodeoxyribonuclease VII small subunit [Ruminococcus flavefaciens]
MGEKEYRFSLEENFSRLEETIEKLEREDISLEEAFQAYSEGMATLKQCSEQIDRVEKRVLKLSGEGQLEVFENGEK